MMGVSTIAAGAFKDDCDCDTRDGISDFIKEADFPSYGIAPISVCVEKRGQVETTCGFSGQDTTRSATMFCVEATDRGGGDCAGERCEEGMTPDLDEVFTPNSGQGREPERLRTASVDLCITQVLKSDPERGDQVLQAYLLNVPEKHQTRQ